MNNILTLIALVFASVRNVAAVRELVVDPVNVNALR
jgi:hypothetical protein